MIAINRGQLIKIKIQCKQLGIDSAEQAYAYSDARTEHVSELRSNEASDLIKFLSAALNEPENGVDKMKGKILSKAHEMGWELPGISSTGKRRINMEKVDNWCIKYGYLKKPLDQHTEVELPQLVTQFSKAWKDYLTGV